MPFNWRQAAAHADPLCVHLSRDGRPLGTVVIAGRRVRHPDHGGWLLLHSRGGTPGVWEGHGLMTGGQQTSPALAHRVGTPCPPAWTEAEAT